MHLIVPYKVQMIKSKDYKLRGEKMKRCKYNWRQLPSFYDAYRVHRYGSNGERMHGTLFKLCSAFTDEEKRQISDNYDNVEFVKIVSEYAPEQVKTGVIIFDKCYEDVRREEI